MNRKLYLLIIFLAFSAACSAEDVTLPVTERGVFEEVPYVTAWNVKSTCSTKAKNDLRKRIKAYQAELVRCGANPVPTATATPEPTPTATPTPTADPIPGIIAWKENLIRYGRKYCDPPAELSRYEFGRGSSYYDGALVFAQVHNYLGAEGVPSGKTSWLDCRDAQRNYYSRYMNQRFSSAPDFRLQGYEVFPHQVSISDLQNLTHLHAYAGYGAPVLGASPDLMQDFLQRETAYLLQAYTQWKKAGNADKDTALQTVLGYAKQQTLQIVEGSSPFVKPFFNGLTADALIEYYEQFGGDDIPALVKALADRTWEEWQGDRFNYILCRNGYSNSECTNEPDAPDTNMLIAPMYAWLYLKGYGGQYRDRADVAFVAAIELRDPEGFWQSGSCIACSGKVFSQNYRLAFKFLEWRQAWAQ